jgi:hypothetical protein
MTLPDTTEPTKITSVQEYLNELPKLQDKLKNDASTRLSNVDSVEGFVLAMRLTQDTHPRGINLRIAYRGQSNRNWDVIPACYRKYKSWQIYPENSEYEMLSELILNCPDDFSQDKFMFDRLVRAQHHGLPTRLLDVTYNPLVALYFACKGEGEEADGIVTIWGIWPLRVKNHTSDTISVLSNLALLTDKEKEKIRGYLSNNYLLATRLPQSQQDIEIAVKKHLEAKGVEDGFSSDNCFDRLYQFIKAEKPYFRRAVNRECFNEIYLINPQKSIPRVIAQSSAFLMGGVNNDLSFADNPMSFPTNLSHTEVHIPHDKKNYLLEQLDGLGINQQFLFPEIDKVAQYIYEQKTRVSRMTADKLPYPLVIRR